MDSSQVLKGVLDIAVLSVVSEQDCYGYEMVKRLRELGLEGVAEASVYGTLRRLYKQGEMSAYLVESEGGPHRKYYSLTKQGNKSLSSGLNDWESLVSAMDKVISIAQPKGVKK
jgi:PadR family transcriptional regulator PadR